MSTKIAKWRVPAAAAFVLAMTAAAPACYAWDDGNYFAHRDTITSSAGDANAVNAATQTIDPWAPHSKNTDIKIDGKRARVGIARYQANKSIEPRGLSGGSAGASGSDAGSGGLTK